MKMRRQCKPILNLQSSFRALLTLSLFLLGLQFAYADVCVWRNPERTMTKIFPEAGDYKTITKIITNEQKENIEKRLQDKLTPGESKDWIYYEITGAKTETLGYIIADAEKGEYGVIEMVMGITPDGKVKGIYIQRSMERDKEFKSKGFLEQFIGKTTSDTFKIGSDINVTNESIAVKAVILGVRKMFIFYDELRGNRE
jgi:Na+-translocating ferredoxin:NAD+ oxidoreductase RnfG subunit